MEQSTKYNINRVELAKLKNDRLQTLIIDSPTNKIRLNNIKQEKGTSTWIWTQSLKEEGHSLPKKEFWDLVKIYSGWPLSRLPNMCSCLAKYNLRHSLSCKTGGFASLRHNHLRNITGNLTDHVQIEPSLQSGKKFDSRSINVWDEA